MTERDINTDAVTATGPTRRDILSGAAGFMAAVAGLSVLAGRAQGQDGGRPNIVYIVADDLGFADVGFRGSDILTPNIDRLAAEGAILQNFYTQLEAAKTSGTRIRSRCASRRRTLAVLRIPSQPGRRHRVG